MSAGDVLMAVAKWQETHEGFPERVYVNLNTAESLAGKITTWVAPRQFGHEALGVTEWYVDPSLGDDELRLES